MNRSQSARYKVTRPRLLLTRSEQSDLRGQNIGDVRDPKNSRPTLYNSIIILLDSEFPPKYL